MMFEFQLVVITRWRLLRGRFRVVFNLVAFRMVLAFFACLVSWAGKVEHGWGILDFLKTLPGVSKRT